MIALAKQIPEILTLCMLMIYFTFFHLELQTTTKNDENSSRFPLAETIAGIAVVLAICLVIFVALIVRRKR